MGDIYSYGPIDSAGRLGGGGMNMDEAEQFEPLSVFSNQQMIEELTRRIGGPETVSINIFINSEGYLIEEKIRSAESLKRVGISMRNVFGQYIKEE